MRKITAGLFISLDGVVEAPDQWHFPYFNDEMGAAVDAMLSPAEIVLFGRVTYDWLRRRLAGPRGGRRGGRRLRQEARGRPQDRRVAPAARLHVAELGAARGRPRRGRGRAERRIRRAYRPERLDLGRPSAAGRRPPRRAAPPRAPDRGAEGHAPLRRGRRADPAAPDVLGHVRDGCAAPRLRPAEAGEGTYEGAREHLVQEAH